MLGSRHPRRPGRKVSGRTWARRATGHRRSAEGPGRGNSSRNFGCRDRRRRRDACHRRAHRRRNSDLVHGHAANPLTACFPAVHDRFGRLAVKPDLKIVGQTAEFAAGDVAWFAIDGTHCCVMSCQHGRPMGRFAGHNVVCDLLGDPRCR